MVINSKEEFIVFENNLGKQIVIDRKKAEESYDDILKIYNVKKGNSLWLD